MSAPLSDTWDPTSAPPEEGAAFWDARLRSPLCTDQDREAFHAWRDRDGANAEAFERLQGGIRALHDVFSSSPELRAMRDRAMEQRPAPRNWRIAAAVAGVALALGAGWSLTGVRAPPAQIAPTVAAASSMFQTGVGESSTVTLSDGSKVTLNTRSRLEVTYGAGRRAVTLVSGQALFEVAKDASRPFVVTAGSRRVTAVGTAFDVRLDGARVRVTMVEGKVKVEATRPTPLQAILPVRQLVAGQQLMAGGALVDKVVRADVPTATSWREGRVVFADTPLSEAVAEMNRYSAAPILIGDPALGRLSVNGMFRTSQPLSFVTAVTQYFPVEARSDASGATVLVPSS